MPFLPDLLPSRGALVGEVMLLLFCDDQAPPMTSFNLNHLKALPLGLGLHCTRAVDEAGHSTCTPLTACPSDLLSLRSKGTQEGVFYRLIPKTALQ